MEVLIRQRYQINGALHGTVKGTVGGGDSDSSSASAAESVKHTAGGEEEGVKPDELTEIILDGCKVKVLDGDAARVLSNFENLEVLCLNQTTLTSILDFPHLPKLRILEMQDNHLSANSGLSVLADGSRVPELEDLSLAGNRIKHARDLACLGPLKKLGCLDLELNPLTQDPLYRRAVFEVLPNVQVVDRRNRTGDQVEDEEDEDDDELDDQDEETENAANGESALKAFYEKGLDDVEDEDACDFEPDEEDEEDDEEEDDEEEDDEEEEDYGCVGSGEQRSSSSSSSSGAIVCDDDTDVVAGAGKASSSASSGSGTKRAGVLEGGEVKRRRQ